MYPDKQIANTKNNKEREEKERKKESRSRFGGISKLVRLGALGLLAYTLGPSGTVGPVFGPNELDGLDPFMVLGHF